MRRNDLRRMSVVDPVKLIDFVGLHKRLMILRESEPLSGLEPPYASMRAKSNA
jgi:hypothetical protein